jgi:hypothetical protein
MEGVDELYAQIHDRVRVVEPLTNKAYACREFAIEDPDGVRIVFSESIEGR